MEVWITRQEEKHRDTCPGILLESILIFLVNGVGTFALLHTLDSVCEWDPFLVSVAVTALFCGFLFQASGTFGCCGFLVKCSCRDLPVCIFWHALKWIPFALEPACRSSWEKSRDLSYHLPAEGFWKSKWGAGCFYFPWHCMWAAWLLNPEASVVCAAPSFCGSPSGGSGKNQPASRYQALSLLLRWNPVRIKLHDEK